MSHNIDRDWSDQFPILSQLAFFDHAGVAPLCGPAAVALRCFAEQAETRGYVGAGWYARLKQIKQIAAQLIRAASADEIALVANTSTGLNMVARGLNWRDGDHVLITNVEFPANRYPWEALQQYGVKLIEVEQHHLSAISATISVVIGSTCPAMI